MAFKKNNPGCPCDCGEIDNRCDCGIEAVEVRIVCDDTFTLLGPAPFPDCNYLTFTGFSDADGTYYVPMPAVGESSSVIIGVWYSDNGVQYDGLLYYYCVALQIRIEIVACEVLIEITWYVFRRSTFSSTCPTLESAEDDGWDVSIWSTFPYQNTVDVCDYTNEEVTFDTGTEDCPASTILTYEMLPYAA